MAFLTKLYTKSIALLNTVYTLFLEEIDGWVLFYEYITCDWMWFKAHEHIFFGIIQSLILIFMFLKLSKFIINYLNYFQSHVAKSDDYRRSKWKTIYKIKAFVRYVSNKSL